MDPLDAAASLSRSLVGTALDFEAAVDVVAREVTELLGDMCVITELRDDGDTAWLEPATAYHRDPARIGLVHALMASDRNRVGEGIAGRVAQNGEAVVIPVVQPGSLATQLKPEFVSFLEHVPVHSLMVAPLETGGRIIGTIAVVRSDPGRPFSDDDRPLLLALAGQAALALRDARLHRELVEANQRLNASFRNTPVGMALIGLDGAYLDVNDALCEFLGRAREELLRTTFLEVTHPDDQAWGLEILAAIQTGTNRVWRVEKRYLRPYGPIVWGDVSISTLYDAAGRPAACFCVIEDITFRKSAERALRESERTFRLVADLVPVGIFRLDAEGQCQFVNRRWCQLAGLPPDAGLGSGWHQPVHPDDRARARHEWERAFEDGTEYSGEYRAERPDGTVLWIAVAVVAVEDEAGSVSGYLGTVTDITHRHAAEEALRDRALHDPLTGLANRSLFFDRLDQALARLTRGSSVVAVLFLDLDGFKALNDRAGHGAGDDVLRHVADRLRQAIRPGDTAARLGGDEFVVLLTDVDGLDAASVVALRVQEELSGPVPGHDDVPVVRTSIGVAGTADPSTPPDVLVARADSAMYTAKHLGGGRVEVDHDAFFR
ncbi:MAG: PAS domain S-box protein [Acidimicrobiia bacterium]